MQCKISIPGPGVIALALVSNFFANSLRCWVKNSIWAFLPQDYCRESSKRDEAACIIYLRASKGEGSNLHLQLTAIMQCHWHTFPPDGGELRQKNVASSIFVRCARLDKRATQNLSRGGVTAMAFWKSPHFVWPLAARQTRAKIQRLRGLRIVCYFKSAICVRAGGRESARAVTTTHYCM